MHTPRSRANSAVTPRGESAVAAIVRASQDSESTDSSSTATTSNSANKTSLRTTSEDSEVAAVLDRANRLSMGVSDDGSLTPEEANMHPLARTNSDVRLEASVSAPAIEDGTVTPTRRRAHRKFARGTDAATTSPLLSLGSTGKSPAPSPITVSVPMAGDVPRLDSIILRTGAVNRNRHSRRVVEDDKLEASLLREVELAETDSKKQRLRRSGRTTDTGTASPSSSRRRALVQSANIAVGSSSGGGGGATSPTPSAQETAGSVPGSPLPSSPSRDPRVVSRPSGRAPTLPAGSPTSKRGEAGTSTASPLTRRKSDSRMRLVESAGASSSLATPPASPSVLPTGASVAASATPLSPRSLAGSPARTSSRGSLRSSQQQAMSQSGAATPGSSAAPSAFVAPASMGAPTRVSGSMAVALAAYSDTTLAALINQLDFVATPLREATLVCVAIEQLNERRMSAGVVWNDTTIRGAVSARSLVALLLDVTREPDPTYASFGLASLAQITRRLGATATSAVGNAGVGGGSLTNGVASTVAGVALLDGKMPVARATLVLDPFGAAVLAQSTTRFVALRDIWQHFVAHGLSLFGDRALAAWPLVDAPLFGAAHAVLVARHAPLLETLRVMQANARCVAGVVNGDGALIGHVGIDAALLVTSDNFDRLAQPLETFVTGVPLAAPADVEGMARAAAAVAHRAELLSAHGMHAHVALLHPPTVDVGASLEQVIGALAMPDNTLGVVWIVDSARRPRALVTQQDAARLLVCDQRAHTLAGAPELHVEPLTAAVLPEWSSLLSLFAAPPPTTGGRRGVSTSSLSRNASPKTQQRQASAVKATRDATDDANSDFESIDDDEVDGEYGVHVVDDEGVFAPDDVESSADVDDDANDDELRAARATRRRQRRGARGVDSGGGGSTTGAANDDDAAQADDAESSDSMRCVACLNPRKLTMFACSSEVSSSDDDAADSSDEAGDDSTPLFEQLIATSGCARLLKTPLLGVLKVEQPSRGVPLAVADPLAELQVRLQCARSRSHACAHA
jgi:hypothetical protein